jgi:hypothetical protein
MVREHARWCPLRAACCGADLNDASAEEWNRQHHASETQYDDQMLMFGLVFSMRELTKQMSPADVTSFNTFNSAVFKVHDFQTATGLRFILCTDQQVEDLTKHLLYIYKNIYVEYVAKNPLSHLAVMPPPRKKKAPPTNPMTQGLITCELFRTQLNRYLTQMGFL